MRYILRQHSSGKQKAAHVVRTHICVNQGLKYSADDRAVATAMNAAIPALTATVVPHVLCRTVVLVCHIQLSLYWSIPWLAA